MLPNGRHITSTPKWAWLWSRDFKNFAVCRDAASLAGSSATAELLVYSFARWH